MDSSLFCRLWEEDRISISIKNVAPSVVTALLATEDRRFWFHMGIDPWGIMRALEVNIRARRIVQGGSTLTQQLARMSVLHRTDRTLQRKILESLLAVLLEVRFAKEKILEAYLNCAYFGHNVYGIELAALTFCGKHARDLTPYESAYLVGLLRAPARYCYCCNPGRAVLRTRLVLSLANFKCPGSSELVAGKLRPRPQLADAWQATAGYPKEYVRAWLKANALNIYPSMRLRVQTTINPRCQHAVDETCAQLRAAGHSGRISIVIQDARSGAVRALAGGVHFQSQQFNSATNGTLQPGSLLKPFVLLAALQRGVSMDRKYESRPIELPLPNGQNWRVRNAGDRYYGNITLSDALVLSDNTVYAQLMLEIGVDPVLQILSRCGVSLEHATPALCLGAVRPGLSPLQICTAYSVFSARGLFFPSSIVSSITDEDGKCLWHEDPHSIPVCTVGDSSTVVEILRRASKEGTGRIRVPQPRLAAKTGTSCSGSWHLSFSDNYRILTWTDTTFLSPNNFAYSGKGVTAKALASRIWTLLSKAPLGFTQLYGIFAGVDSLNVKDLLWMESEFESP